MLPEILIKEVFSLSEKDNRLSLSLGVIFNDDGSVASIEIVQSIIKVDFRLNYIEADELIDSLISLLLRLNTLFIKISGSI